MRSRTTFLALAAAVTALMSLLGASPAGAARTGPMREDVAALRIDSADLEAVSIQRPAAAGSAQIDVAAPAQDKLWVFFTDKALSTDGERSAVERAAAELSPRALWRRSKMGMEVNRNDVPVAASYADAVAATGAEIVVRSRWLNAVSVVAAPAEAAAIARLPFVREVRPVARATQEIPEIAPASEVPSPGAGRSLDYGASFGQLDQIQVTDLHDEGYDGTGVLIVMLDTGFDTNHQAYRHLDIVAERDFINNDGETANQPGDPSSQDSHGTMTLSCVGGAYAGQLYGGSYNASFALAKTERVDTEIEIEEDYWVAAAEWADSLGADVMSSSLGYFDWYDYEDMDGNTAVITIAADMAAARGIVVVNSMGNEGNNSWRYMIAPADGDSVVSVGAVNQRRNENQLQLGGADVRRPDQAGRDGARLLRVRGDHADTASYAYASGTSFSCPITAGAVGLLLDGHPEWTPSDVIEALRSTATQSGSPDTLMGWGIVQAADAMDYGAVRCGPTAACRRSRVRVRLAEPIRTRDERALRSARRRGHCASPFTMSRVVSCACSSTACARAGSHAVGWDGTDAAGDRVASGDLLPQGRLGPRDGHREAHRSAIVAAFVLTWTIRWGRVLSGAAPFFLRHHDPGGRHAGCSIRGLVPSRGWHRHVRSDPEIAGAGLGERRTRRSVYRASSSR